MLKELAVVMVMLFAVSAVGCGDVLEKFGLSNDSHHELSSDELARQQQLEVQQKLKNDLKQLDKIRMTTNSDFIDLEEKFKHASHKKTSTVQLRTELDHFASGLRAQNEQFKHQYFATSDVAKLRNIVMQLNYTTIHVINGLDNPAVVATRYPTAVKKQKHYIDQYNNLRNQIEAKL